MKIHSKLVMMFFLLVGATSSYSMEPEAAVASMNVEQLRGAYTNALETLRFYERAALVTGVVVMPVWGLALHAFGYSIQPAAGGMIALAPVVLAIGFCKVMALRAGGRREHPEWS
jgi:hypothetical protein